MRAKSGKFLCRLLVFAAVLTGSALTGSGAAAAAEAAMPVSGLTSQPVGHYDFCRRYARQCRAHKDSAPPPLTPKIRRLLQRVNAEVNKAVRAATDDEIYGQEEYWDYPDKAGNAMRGDCEDYVLLKQRELQKRGLPAGALLITVVRKPDGEAHAVLSVRTQAGDYILDNLRDDVLNWRETEYRYIKRQSAAHAGLWVSVASPQAAPGAAMQAKTAGAAEAGSLASTRAFRRD